MASPLTIDPTALQSFLTQRQEILTRAFEAGDVNAIMTHYDPDLDFSDFAWGATHYNLAQYRAFLDHTYQTVPGLRLITHGVHGTSKTFSVWEWTLIFVATETDAVRGLEKGKEMRLRGCSLHWWKCVDGKSGEGVGDWRIVKEGDYACPEGGEGK